MYDHLLDIRDEQGTLVLTPKANWRGETKWDVALWLKIEELLKTRPHAVVFHLSLVTTWHSASPMLLRCLRQRLLGEGVPLALCGLQPAAREGLRLSGAEHLFQLAGSLEEALEIVAPVPMVVVEAKG